MTMRFYYAQVVAWPTNLGWMMGPWLLFQLVNGATLALFNGVATTAPFLAFVQNAKVLLCCTDDVEMMNTMTMTMISGELSGRSAEHHKGVEVCLREVV